MGYNVKLEYFKAWSGPRGRGGKYYSSGEYETSKEHIGEIFTEVAALAREGRLPGLVEGHSPYHVYVRVPDHPHDHPHLVVYEGEFDE